jgi:hypothetical protein
MLRRAVARVTLTSVRRKAVSTEVRQFEKLRTMVSRCGLGLSSALLVGARHMGQTSFAAVVCRKRLMQTAQTAHRPPP